jgi:hypothetical protein
MPAGITSAYRTKSEQKALYDLYGYPRAEYPGRSQHGEGVALDLPEPARSWMATYGASYGWKRTVMPSEPWHFEYIPSADSSATKEDDMPLSAADLAAVRSEAREAVKEVLRAPEFQEYFRAVPSMSAKVGTATLGPAPMTTFVADTRVDVMRVLDIVKGLSVATPGAPAADVDYDALAKKVADVLAARLAA